MSVHVAGVLGLIAVFVMGALRPINLGALALVMTFLLGIAFTNESPARLFSGFPVDLFVLLVAVTWLFAIAARNGTIEWIVSRCTRLVGGRRALLPWIVFVVAALPTSAGALGSAGVALLAPIAVRIAERYDIDRRLIALMVLHGAACGNFSPLNVLGAIVLQAVARTDAALSPATLFFANVAYNVALGVIVYFLFGGPKLAHAKPAASDAAIVPDASAATRTAGTGRVVRTVTMLVLLAVGVASLVFGIGIGPLALVAAVILQFAFARASRGAEQDIAWGVVLLVCGIVTYVAALQRFGTVDAIGVGIAGLGAPLLGALLICAVGAVTSAFASSAGILGAMMMLAVPFIGQGGVSGAGFVIALAISATVVDSCPFSTAGALVVANTPAADRERVYRALLAWGGAMALTAPVVTWLLFVVW